MAFTNRNFTPEVHLCHTSAMESTGIISLAIIALSLSVDCFAVSISGSASIKTLSVRQILRASLSFGLFQAIMPALGWLAGRTVVDLVADYDHWLVFGLLAAIGGKMIWEATRSDNGRGKDVDITKGWLLLTLSLATSIDALAVGLSFAFLEVDIVLACFVIGVIAFLASLTGFLLSKKLGELVGERAGIIGGIVLIIIGLRILLSHIL